MISFLTVSSARVRREPKPRDINTLEYSILGNAGVDQGTIHTRSTNDLVFAKVQHFRLAKLEQAVETASAQEINIATTFISWDNKL